MVTSSPFFFEGNPDSSVAICTLSSHELLRNLAASEMANRVAIIGPLETENLGIERMLSTLLARPTIRWLVLCGQEQRGRYQAQALQSLFAHGVAADGSIPQARSKRARLPSLSPPQVEAARNQVGLRDLAGTEDMETIAAAVDDCLAQHLEPVNRSLPALEAEPIAVAPRPHRLAERDPNGYLLIFVDAAQQRLLIEHYGNDDQPRHRFVGPDAESLCAALIEWQIISSLEHAAYLGRELTKAELALKSGSTYRQDASLQVIEWERSKPERRE
ncbi:MAG TPA: DUF4346 domain-containing protein [Chloroflexota bacterium]